MVGTLRRYAKGFQKFVKRNPVKTAAAIGGLHAGSLGAVIGAAGVKAYQNRGKIKRVFRKLRNTVRRR